MNDLAPATTTVHRRLVRATAKAIMLEPTWSAMSKSLTLKGYTFLFHTKKFWPTLHMLDAAWTMKTTSDAQMLSQAQIAKCEDALEILKRAHLPGRTTEAELRHAESIGASFFYEGNPGNGYQCGTMARARPYIEAIKQQMPHDRLMATDCGTVIQNALDKVAPYGEDAQWLHYLNARRSYNWAYRPYLTTMPLSQRNIAPRGNSPEPA